MLHAACSDLVQSNMILVEQDGATPVHVRVTCFSCQNFAVAAHNFAALISAASMICQTLQI